MLPFFLTLWGCGSNLQCGEGTHQAGDLCVADPRPPCPACPPAQPELECEPCPEPEKAKAKVPEFTGKTAATLNFSQNGQTIDVPAGAFFEVRLAAPATGDANDRYTWAPPMTRGKVRFVEHTVGKRDGRAIPWTFVFFAIEPGRGQLRINRKYPGANATPAPDYAVRLTISD